MRRVAQDCVGKKTSLSFIGFTNILYKRRVEIRPHRYKISTDDHLCDMK